MLTAGRGISQAEAAERPSSPPSIGGEVARPQGETERGSTSSTVASSRRIDAFRPDGSTMNLAALTPADIDFAAMANALSKIARFNGIYRGPAYPVAQHCVMGADALFAETGDTLAAGYFILHDGHEYVLGDWTRPAVAYLESVIERRFLQNGMLKVAIEIAKTDADFAIFTAASLPPLHRQPRYSRLVADMDDRMLRAEIVELFGPHAAIHAPAADRPPPKLTGAIRPWGACKAEEAFVDRLGRYCGVFVR